MDNYWYPYLIVFGGVFLLTLYGIWNRSTGDSGSDVDPADRLIAICVIAFIMVAGAFSAQAMNASTLNTKKDRANFERKAAVCREMPEPSQRTLCMMQVVK